MNLDVLLQIAALAEKTTQSRMMKTCRILNKEGARKLLKEEVWLTSERHLASFILFMLADRMVRFAALRNLRLELKDISRNTGAMLSDLFVELSTAANTRLQVLRLVGNLEDVLLAHPRLSEGIAHLTTLESITMSNIGPQGSTLLMKSRSSLSSASLLFNKEVLYSNVYRALPQDFDPLRLLRGSGNTLKTLTLCDGCFTLTPNIAVYPRLTTLTVEGLWLPYVPVLHRAFPNLNRITTYFGMPDTPLEIPSIGDSADYREANRTYQLDHGSWPAFTSFHGPSRDLYILGLLCPIRYINLDQPRGDRVEATRLQTILSDTCPTHLVLSAYLQPNDTFLSEQWMAALFQTRTPPLRALDVTIKVYQLDYDDEDDMLDDALVSDLASALFGATGSSSSLCAKNNFCDALESSSLSAFRLTIKGVERPEEDEIEPFIQDLDVEELAYRFQDAAQSLEVVSVVLAFESVRPCCAVDLGSLSETLKLQIPTWDWTDVDDGSNQEDRVEMIETCDDDNHIQYSPLYR